MALTEGWGDDAPATIPVTDAPKGIVEGWGDEQAPEGPGFFGKLRQLGGGLLQATRDDAAMFQRGATLGAAPAIGAAFDAVTSGKSFAQARAERKAEEDAAGERSGIAGNVAELAGGLATGSAVPVTGALAAASPVVRGAVVGGGLGAAQGVGETVGAGGTAREALANASAGATGGALTGGALEGIAGKLVKGAPESADNWITKDIGGQGEVEARERTTDQLRKDKDDIRRVVKSSPELAAAVDKAAAGHAPDLQALAAKIEDHLAEATAGKPEAYAKVAEVAPIRFGDLDDKLAEAQKALPVSDRKIASEIASERKALREGWATTDAHEIPAEALAQEVGPGVTVEKLLNNYRGVLANPTAHPESLAGAKQGISELEKAYGKPMRKYDPDTIVPPEVLRQHVTARQRAEALTEDYGNATPSDRERAAKSVARPFEQFFHGHLDAAGEVSPEAQAAVNAIRDSDARVSALINMKNAVKERFVASQRAADKPMAMAFGQRGAVHRVGQKLGLGALGLPGLALAMGHPGVAGAVALTKTAPAAKRMADKALAALIAKAATGSVGHKMMLEAIQYGVPRAVALRIASSAVGGLINDVDGGQPAVAP